MAMIGAGVMEGFPVQAATGCGSLSPFYARTSSAVLTVMNPPVWKFAMSSTLARTESAVDASRPAVAAR